MSKKHRRRPKRWPKVLMLLIFAVAAGVGVYHCLVRKPDLKQPAAASPAKSEEPAASAADESGGRKKDFYTILLSGEDDGNGGSDTNILVGFDTEGKSVTCVSIPRDSGMYIKGRVAKINSAYNRGGVQLLASSISDALGVPIDYTVKINLKGFAKLVDAIGGVDFDIPINMNYDDPYQNLHIHFKKGPHHLNGKEALEVVRFRHNNKGMGGGYGTEDLGRIGTQQAFLKAVAKKTLTLSNVGKISEFSRIFHDSVDTDLSMNYLAWFGTKVISIGTDNIHFTTLPGAWSDARSLYLIDREKTLSLVNTSLNPYKTDRTSEDLRLPS
jgi:LCP family protein required for cell wall assembly